MIVLLIIFIILSYIIIEWFLNNKAPKESVIATLVKKKTTTSMDANNVIHTSYILIFDTDGNRRKFTVGYLTYKKYKENQKGTLIYKRKRFVDFIV